MVWLVLLRLPLSSLLISRKNIWTTKLEFERQLFKKKSYKNQYNIFGSTKNVKFYTESSYYDDYSMRVSFALHPPDVRVQQQTIYMSIILWAERHIGRLKYVNYFRNLSKMSHFLLIITPILASFSNKLSIMKTLLQQPPSMIFCTRHRFVLKIQEQGGQARFHEPILIQLSANQFEDFQK